MDKENYLKWHEHLADQIASDATKHIQTGTDVTVDAMKHFVWKGERCANVGYEQAKGNLYEYIENAKFVRNYANSGNGVLDKMPVTDLPESRGGFGGHTAPDDFRVIRDGKELFQAQAKVNNDVHNTAVNFVNPKYEGMQRITTADQYENVIAELDKMAAKGEISRAAYQDAVTNIRQRLTDDSSGVTSGGTTTKELLQFKGRDGKIDVDAVRSYARKFEMQQMSHEVASSAINGMASRAIMTGVISGVSNLFDVYKDKKTLNQALKETGLAVKDSAVKGGLVGAGSAILRFIGLKQEITALSRGNVATAMASAIVDCGVSIYAYSKGEISKEKLQKELQSTIISASSAYYFTEALKATLGVSSGVFLPMAIYSVTSSMIMATRALIKQARLNAQEYNRIAELLKEETRVLKEYRKELNREFAKFRNERKQAMDDFLYAFDNCAFNTLDYSGAIDSMIILSNNLGFALQHKEFKDFDAAMNRHDTFILK